MESRTGEVYTQDEVTKIIRRALQAQGSKVCTQEDLEEIAAASGVPLRRLQEAIAQERGVRPDSFGAGTRRKSLGTFLVWAMGCLAFVVLGLFVASMFWVRPTIVPGEEVRAGDTGAPTSTRDTVFIP